MLSPMLTSTETALVINVRSRATARCWLDCARGGCTLSRYGVCSGEMNWEFSPPAKYRYEHFPAGHLSESDFFLKKSLIRG